MNNKSTTVQSATVIGHLFLPASQDTADDYFMSIRGLWVEGAMEGIIIIDGVFSLCAKNNFPNCRLAKPRTKIQLNQTEVLPTGNQDLSPTTPKN